MAANAINNQPANTNGTENMIILHRPILLDIIPPGTHIKTDEKSRMDANHESKSHGSCYKSELLQNMNCRKG